jgi:hypothetical protein
MRKYIYLIPLTVLVITLYYSLYVVNTTNIIFGTKQYYGIALVIGSIIITILRKDFGLYLTGVIVFLGTINVVAFTAAIESYSFGFGLNGSKLNFKTSRSKQGNCKTWNNRCNKKKCLLKTHFLMALQVFPGFSQNLQANFIDRHYFFLQAGIFFFNTGIVFNIIQVGIQLFCKAHK